MLYDETRLGHARVINTDLASYTRLEVINTVLEVNLSSWLQHHPS